MNDNLYFNLRDLTEEYYIKLYFSFLTSKRYRSLTDSAKIIYSFLLYRQRLSLKNNWIDENGFAYMFLSYKEISKIFNYSNDKINNIFKSLEKLDLIEKKKNKVGYPNKIFLKKYIIDKDVYNLKLYKY